MAYSYFQYTGDGATQIFSTPPYLEQGHIHVYVNGVETTSFTWVTSSTISITTAPASGAVVIVKRITPLDTQLVDFTSGSLLNEETMDLMATFNLYAAQEAEDKTDLVLAVDENNLIDSHNKRITNLADAVDDTDAMNKQSVAALTATSVAQAEAARDTAVSARDSALLSASSSSSAVVTATAKAAEATEAAADAEAVLASLAIGDPNGVCPLGGDGIVPSTYLPAMTVEFASEAEALAGTSTTKVMNPATTKAVVDASTPPITRENLIIDGNFDHWFEGTSQTSNGYGSDTMWYNGNIGSTKTHSRQAFALGDTDTWDAPAAYYSRTVVSSVAGASNGVYKEQRVEDVKKLAGRKVTLSFRAKADAAKNIAVELYQDFGTGGSPSSTVSGIGSQLVALTTAWQDFEITIDMPSILGKTLGSNNNNYTAVNFWFDAGSSFSTRAASLGQQSGTFDIAQVKLEIGDYGTQFVAPDPTNGAAQCARYFQQFSRTGGASVALKPLGIGYATDGPNSLYFVPLQPMRTAPSVSFSAPATFVGAIHDALFNTLTAISATTIDACGVFVKGTISTSYSASYSLALCPNTSSTAKIICDARI